MPAKQPTVVFFLAPHPNKMPLFLLWSPLRFFSLATNLNRQEVRETILCDSSSVVSLSVNQMLVQKKFECMAMKY